MDTSVSLRQSSIYSNHRIIIRVLAVLLGLIVALSVTFINPESAWAAEAQDVDDAVLLEADPGTATIVEYDEGDGTNHVGDLGDEKDLTFENDLPSYTHEKTENTETGETTDQYYRTDTEQPITLPKDMPDPDPDQTEITVSDPVECLLMGGAMYNKVKVT